MMTTMKMMMTTMRMMMTKQFTIPDHDTDDDLNWDYDQDCEEQHDPFSDSDIDD